MYITERIANYSRYRGAIEVKQDTLSQHHTDELRDGNTNEAPADSTSSVQLYGAWKEFLGSASPYAYIWTHSYMHPYSDARAIDGLWDCTKHINRSIWGPRWKKKGDGIHATVVAERHKRSQELRGRLHFHVLVQKPSTDLSDERFTAIVNEAALWLRDDFNRPMSALDRVDVRKVYDADGLAKYLTKDLQTTHWPKGDNVFFLRPEGPEGVVFRLNGNAKLSAYH